MVDRDEDRLATQWAPMFDLADIFMIGIVLAAVSVPLLFGLIPRNPIYGFRVPATMRDDAVWYAINRSAAREAIIIGLVLAVLAWLSERAGLDVAPVRVTLSVALLAALVVFTVRGWRAADRMAREKAAPR